MIYADVVTCSTKVNMVLDDDRVEYAEIERTVDGEPLTRVASCPEIGEPLRIPACLCFSTLHGINISQKGMHGRRLS